MTGLANNDLTLIWSQISGTNTLAALMDVLPDLIAVYGSAAATLGAEWYDEMREAAEVAGQFTGIAAELPDAGRAQALAGWATATGTDAASTLALVSGGLQRVIASADRGSVALSSTADPHADGWQRVARGDGCAFCKMLAGRAELYSEATADFASHDKCHCVAVAAFKDRPRPVKPYTPSLRESSDADRARVRAWLTANPQ